MPPSFMASTRTWSTQSIRQPAPNAAAARQRSNRRSSSVGSRNAMAPPYAAQNDRPTNLSVAHARLPLQPHDAIDRHRADQFTHPLPHPPSRAVSPHCPSGPHRSCHPAMGPTTSATTAPSTALHLPIPTRRGGHREPDRKATVSSVSRLSSARRGGGRYV